MLQIILAILAFGMLVIVHEFGHFITAKRGGVQVNEFWIGMGPTLLKKEHNGTLYCLKLLPFGGACVMEGEDEESESEHAFGKASLPRRMLIVAAGALMNFLVGFLIVLAVIQPNGPNGGYIVSTIDSVDPASTAAAAGGLQAGDEILEVDGYNILMRSDFEIALARGADTTYEVVVRRDGEKITLPAVVLEATIEGEDGRKMIGLTFAEQPDSIGMHINMAVRTSVNYARHGLGKPRHARDRSGRRRPAFRPGRRGGGHGDHGKLQHFGVFAARGVYLDQPRRDEPAAAARAGRRTAGVPHSGGHPPQARACKV